MVEKKKEKKRNGNFKVASYKILFIYIYIIFFFAEYSFILFLTNYKALFILLAFYLFRIHMPADVTYINALVESGNFTRLIIHPLITLV